MKIEICLCFLTVSIQMVSAFAPLRGVLLSPAKRTNERRLGTGRATETSNDATNVDGVDVLNRSNEFLRLFISEASDKEVYIIGSIFAITAVRLVLERQKQKKETAGHGDDQRLQEGLSLKKVERQKQKKETAGHGDDQPSEEGLSLKKVPFLFTSLATVAASLIVPFLDLDAALLFAEATPFGELRLIVPSLQQAELVDSAFDVEEVLEEINVPNSEEGNESDEEITTLTASTSEDKVVSDRMLTITGITIGICGTALTKSKRALKKNRK